MNGTPKILILMSDEHRFDTARFAGNDVVSTPFLDDLARDAVIFDNCYAPSPICYSRIDILEGQSPKNHASVIAE